METGPFSPIQPVKTALAPVIKQGRSTPSQRQPNLNEEGTCGVNAPAHTAPVTRMTRIPTMPQRQPGLMVKNKSGRSELRLPPGCHKAAGVETHQGAAANQLPKINNSLNPTGLLESLPACQPVSPETCRSTASRNDH